jgi:Tfp pilus assembly protein PilV
MFYFGRLYFFMVMPLNFAPIGKRQAARLALSWLDWGGKPSEAAAYSLMEVMISVTILAIMVMSLFAAFNSGFGSMTISREEMRATQIMTQKLEAIRLLTWSQLSNSPATFQESYNPLGSTNGTPGTVFYGTLSTSAVGTNIPNGVSYKGNLRLVTVTVTWTNGYNSRSSIPHFRQMQTLSCNAGLQNYIYGVSQ